MTMTSLELITFLERILLGRETFDTIVTLQDEILSTKRFVN